MTITITRTSRALDHDYPAQSTVASLHEEQLVLRAVEAYRFFYPTVSAEAICEGNRNAGIADGKALMLLDPGPRHRVFTASSDTPYAAGVLDLAAMGPVVIDVPAGPFVGLVDDHHQRWIADVGIPGPDAGHGGRYLILPPDYAGDIPDGHHVARSPTSIAIVALRALPHGGDVAAAKDALQAIAIYALHAPDRVLPYIDASEHMIDTTPLRWEPNIHYWQHLHDVLDREPVLDEFRPMYGALAALGIAKGRPFAPDVRQRRLLELAAALALDEMRVAAFASERADRVVWPDRRWEWVGLVPDDANFETDTFLDLEARDRWFYQAIVASPAMFRRKVGGGSVYWLAARDASGAYLDGSRTYKLVMPTPVPAGMFWSVTAYDAKTRSQVVTPQDKAVLGSLKDRLRPDADGNLELYLGPIEPPGAAGRWIQTAPDAGFFLYVRIYGPDEAALDGTWKPSDLTIVDDLLDEETAIPLSIVTPEEVHTPLGTLELPLGLPTESTAARLYDHIDYLHAVDAFIDAMQAVSMYALCDGLRVAGVADNEVLLFSGLMDSRSLFLTANCDTVYFWSVLDLSRGPIVVEVPPRVLGVVDDMWFRWVSDVGMAGPDRGDGGRYLFVPPGYADPLPDGGCFIAHARTNHVGLLGRAFLVDDDPAPAAASIRSGMKIYSYVPGGVGTSVAAFLRGDAPFAHTGEPPETRFIEGTGLAIDTIPPNDASFYELLNAVVQLEPASALDPELAGSLAAIGIVKDRPFRPDARMRRILGDAVAIANATARTIAMRPRASEGFHYYGTDSAWVNPLFVGGYEFSQPPPEVTAQGIVPAPDPHARTLHARIAMFYLATGITPAMCMRMTGIGSQYLAAFCDSEGQPLDGGRRYTIRLPADIPAGLFWSVTAYDNQTRSMLETAQRFPRAGSQSYPTPAAVADADGSTTIHLGPVKPEGVADGNWIQTVAGIGYFVILRLYSPLEPFFDKSWRPSEIVPL